MTGQHKDTKAHQDQPDNDGGPSSKKPTGGVGPSTRELLHLLNSIEGKA